MPLFCPKCGKLMKWVDKPYYNIYKFCLDCHARAEDKLKKEGKYNDHYGKINDKILDKRILEFKQYVADKLDESNDSFISENGEIEKWVGKLDREKVDIFTNEIVEHLESLKG